MVGCLLVFFLDVAVVNGWLFAWLLLLMVCCLHVVVVNFFVVYMLLLLMVGCYMVGGVVNG